MPIIDFLASTAGRWTRGILGITVGALGVVLGGWWLLLLIPGVVFVVTGLAGVCLLGPIVGRPLR